MDAIRMRLRFFVITFFGAMAVGTLGFMAVEKQSFGDSLYFCIVTMATVGFGDIHPTTPLGKALTVFIIVMGVGTFLGVVANFTELVLSKREHAGRMEKLNMVIGAFYSEVGTRLLALFAGADPHLDAIRGKLILPKEWTHEEFLQARADLGKRDYAVNIQEIDLERLCTFLVEKRDFMVRLLENPVLLEHEAFTSLLWAVFHLTEELAYREDKSRLPETDRAHLAGDINRAYGQLVREWLDYMRHLKNRYPYLFSLALRTNPFDRDASPIVR